MRLGVFISLFALAHMYTLHVCSRNLLLSPPPRFTLYDYLRTGEEIILTETSDTVLTYDTLGEASLYVDLYDGNGTRQRCLFRENCTQVHLSSSLLTGDINDYRRYKCRGNKSVYMKGTLNFRYVAGPIHYNLKKTILFKLLPSVPQLEVQLNYSYWDYSTGQPMGTELDRLIIKNPQDSVYVLRFWNAWKDLLIYESYYTDIDHDKDFCIEDYYQCEYAFVIIARNEYGDTYSDDIHIEDLITDPSERENMLYHKDDYLTSVFRCRQEDIQIRTEGLYVSVEPKPGSECTMILYGMDGMELVRGGNSLTAPRHGMYVLKIKSGERTETKKIRL